MQRERGNSRARASSAASRNRFSMLWPNASSPISLAAKQTSGARNSRLRVVDDPHHPQRRGLGAAARPDAERVERRDRAFEQRGGAVVAPARAGAWPRAPSRRRPPPARSPRSGRPARRRRSPPRPVSIGVLPFARCSPSLAMYAVPDREIGATSVPRAIAHVRAFAVHVFTASGAALALAALVYAVRGALDGDVPLPRRSRSSSTASTARSRAAQGRRGAPALVGRRARSGGRFHHLRVRAGLCDRRRRSAAATCWRCPPGMLIVITGALYFADREMKTADNYFRGFPALWNAAAFYLFLLRPPPWLGGGHRRRAGGADLRAVQVHPSDAGARGCARSILQPWSLGRCWRWSRCCAILSRGRGSLAAWSSIGLYFLAVGLTDEAVNATHARTPDRSPCLGGAGHADRARDRARHRQPRLHLGPGLARSPRAGAAGAPDRPVAGLHLPRHHAVRADLADGAHRAACSPSSAWAFPGATSS